MKIKMLVDAPGSPDGVTVNEYAGGVTYDVPRDLADTLVKYEFAERVTKPAAAPAPRPRAKKATAPPENK